MPEYEDIELDECEGLFDETAEAIEALRISEGLVFWGERRREE